MQGLKLTKSYCYNANTVRLDGLPIGQIFDRTADKYPDREAFVFPDDNVRITYGELKKKIDKFASGLIALGFNHGDRLGIWSDNHLEWVIVHFAALKIGLVLVHLQTGISKGQVEHVLHKTQCSGLVMGLSTRDLFSVIADVIPELMESSPGKISSSEYTSFHTVINLEKQAKNGMYQMSEILELGESVGEEKLRERMEAVDYDDVSNIFFTSGSTGFPKAVVHTHHNRLRSRAASSYVNDCNRVFCMSPFVHCSGSEWPLLGAAVIGKTYIIGPLRWRVPDIIRCLQEEQITALFFWPHMLYDAISYVKANAVQLPALQAILTGGSMMPDSLLTTAAEVFDAKVFRAYGSTETLGILRQNPASPLAITTSKDGYPSAGCEVKIVNEQGHVLPVGICGEMWFRSFFTFIYYLGDDEKTREVKKPDGWFCSGDVGVMDESGYCRVMGRKTDVIVRHSKKIYPVEIEVALIQHPGVVVSSVVPLPDERLNEDICACVILKEGETASTEDLRHFCRSRVHQDHQPDYILVFKEFPKINS
ncbi:putative acyl-CoA synthetase YngI [Ptychodera flava]|uniref:putative acyl-CoA synthetase YngI n=1 Tax=Ptychodera flava TaxID=63121 RepID=UPI00396A4B69